MKNLSLAGLNTVSRLAVLMHIISQGGEASQSDIPAAIGISTYTTSREVDIMVNIGWLRREATPTDRRFTTLRLTVRGRRVAEWIAAGADPTQLPRQKNQPTNRDRMEDVGLAS